MYHSSSRASGAERGSERGCCECPWARVSGTGSRGKDCEWPPHTERHWARLPRYRADQAPVTGRTGPCYRRTGPAVQGEWSLCLLVLESRSRGHRGQNKPSSERLAQLTEHHHPPGGSGSREGTGHVVTAARHRPPPAGGQKAQNPGCQRCDFPGIPDLTPQTRPPRRAAPTARLTAGQLLGWFAARDTFSFPRRMFPPGLPARAAASSLAEPLCSRLPAVSPPAGASLGVGAGGVDRRTLSGCSQGGQTGGPGGAVSTPMSSVGSQGPLGGRWVGGGAGPDLGPAVQ